MRNDNDKDTMAYYYGANGRLKKKWGANDLSPCSQDEWMIGRSITAHQKHREIIVHMLPPRFFARIVMLDKGKPVLSEEPVNTHAGIVYIIDDETMLCEIDWIDQPQKNEIIQSLEAVREVIDIAYGQGLYQFFRK